MFEHMLRLFEARRETIGQCAYTEVVMALDGLTIEAMISFSSATHRRFLDHFGLNARQVPLLQFRPGLDQGQASTLFVAAT